MALRALVRLRNTCGLQLRTLAQPSQDKRKTVARSFAAGTSVDEGSHVEQKLENPVLSSGSEAGHPPEESVLKDALQPAGSDETEFKASIKVDAPYVRFVAGKGGATRDIIEKATNTRIHIPSASEIKSGTSLVIKGPSQEAVDAAVTRIQRVLQRAEKIPNMLYTHFISLPLASHQHLVEQVRGFRDSVVADEVEASSYVSWFTETSNKENSTVATLKATKRVSKINATHIIDPDLEGFFSDGESSDDEIEGSASIPRRKISRSLFIRPETIHLTVLMLKLFTEQRVNIAAEVLQGVKDKVLEALDGHEARVHLKWLECLRGSPAEARVLYMKVQEVDPENRLHQACQAIKDAFIKAGLVADADKNQDLKLHATLMNAAYSRRLNNSAFDARRVLLKHRLEDWGEYTIKEVHLSQRFFYDESGYYHCCGSLELPSANSESSV